MPSPIAAPPAVFGISPGPVLTRFQWAVLSLGPMHYYLCNEPAGATALADYMGARNLTTVTGTPGAGPISPGERASFSVINTSAKSAAAFNPPTTVTLGFLINATTGSLDTGYFGGWNNSGVMLAGGTPVAVRMYCGATFCGESVDIGGLGTQFIVGTSDGTNIRLYRNGVLRAGPTAATPIASSEPLWINGYNGSQRTGTFSMSDAFVIPYAMTASQIAKLQALR